MAPPARTSALPVSLVACCLLGLAHSRPAVAEPSLVDTLCDMGFGITGECGIGYTEIICTHAQGINCFVTLAPGPYKVTLLAEHSGAHASLELSVFTDFDTPAVGPLLFDGPDGNEGVTNPRVERFVIVDEEFGFTLLSPDDRFYSVNFLNPDPVPFGPGFLPGHHVRTFQNDFDQSRFLIAFEQSTDGGDEDFQDLVFAVDPMFECPDGTAADSDGDGLLDCWETTGEIDFDKDGMPDVLLVNADGVVLSDPDKKDLFVEVDWRMGRQPSAAGIQAWKDVFAAAPPGAGGSPNPGGPGINLWVDTGDLMEDGVLVGDDMGGGEQVPGPITCLEESFYATKQQYFAAARRYVFRYAISGETAGDENECEDGVKVGGKGEIGGNDFIVYNNDPSYFLHEMGHTLNLRHGGFENQNNKPNYISMMNYNYGLCIPQVDGGCILDFAPPLCASCPGGRGVFPPPEIEEDDLDEAYVLDPNDDNNIFVFRDDANPQVTTTWPADTDVDGDGIPDGVDWNADGSQDDSGLMIDTNEDGEVDTDPLLGHDDWTNLAIGFAQFGEAANAPINPETVPERTLEDYQAYLDELYTTDLAIAKSDLPDPVNAGAPLVYTVEVTNLGPNLANGVRVTDTLPAETSYVSDTGGCAEGPPGTLVCGLDPIPAGGSASFAVTVVVEPGAVAALPAPVTVENQVAVENRVPLGLGGALGEAGGDSDTSDNEASEETTVNRPPVADAGGPYLAECQGALTPVALDGSDSFDPDGDAISFHWTTNCPNGVFDDPTSATPILSVGGPPPCPVVCEATLTVTDPMMLSDTDDGSVTVDDTTPPTVSVELEPTTLWPPNHELVPIVAHVESQDTCDPAPAVVLESITSDEPDDVKGGGDGHTTGDIQADVGTEDLEFSLRAERQGRGDGRTYTVTYKATDDCGNEATASAEVFVPHNP